jgi:hypothetical protein
VVSLFEGNKESFRFESAVVRWSDLKLTDFDGGRKLRSMDWGGRCHVRVAR